MMRAAEDAGRPERDRGEAHREVVDRISEQGNRAAG
jgi:hypothetical protein